MLLLAAKHIEKTYQYRLIIKAEKLQVYQGERIGIVGPNGVGKSTLMKILAQEVHPDVGEVQVHAPIAYIPQMELPQTIEIHQKRQREWHLPRTEGLEQTDNLKPQSLSGGEQTRIKIASALSSDAKVLFADEPTSHLDIQGIEKLQTELSHFKGAVILISHDRELLDQVCTRIWEMEEGHIQMFKGNYTRYLEQKERMKKRQWEEYEQYQKEKQRLLEAKRHMAQKSKAVKKAPSRMGPSEARLHKRKAGKTSEKLYKKAKAIETRIDQLEPKEKPVEEKAIVFDTQDFKGIHRSSVLSFTDVDAVVQGQKLFSELNGTISPRSRVAILGANGVGKTTLLNMILAGHDGLTRVKTARMGYFDQKLEHLRHDHTILDNVSVQSPYSEHFIRTVLARLQFRREDVHKRIRVLSGGEKVKVALAKVFLGNFNVLLLDEPTNFLDLPAKEALEEVLCAYPGTILFVSHDRAFIKKVATHIIEIKDHKAQLKHVDHLTNQGEKESKKKQTDIETTLLALDMEIADIIGKLSTVNDEEEKARLEQTYETLLRKKREITSD
ncbi:ribosomal protection-like ABC-F family protein [Caldalkalibacillus salinus]|uniref:ribosomal protection-like ABC-F family protein n=1 Tax=Caldalkalibacillus salinus TaxID=2803787 RepID=UPI0019233B7D|nr:ABC-F type ribosomal protection protein [Caldalkalibacillus salinus]